MSIQLNPEEEQLQKDIAKLVAECREAFSWTSQNSNVSEWISEAGQKAHKLHMLLKGRGLEPRHHAYMIKNRELQPDHPDFYKHFHPLEDLLKFLEDEHANDDPEDQTIGVKFTFRVYSRRWGHHDEYRIRRTEDGWHVEHMSINGPCDKSGRPILFSNFRQDSIQYPARLDLYMEWLWDQAAEQGLDRNKVQSALQELADWVSNTERNAPSDGVWEGV